MKAEVKAPRDFTYITPRKGRLSEYEAVTCYTQADPDVLDAPGWFLRTAEGRGAWLRDSTRLSHPCWFDFRDPAAHWQRTYVRMQAEQERALELMVEQAARDGAFQDFAPAWTHEMVGKHYRTWTYFDYGIFRCFAQVQREALSDTLGNVFCFEAVDRMRHAQAVVIYLMSLEENIPGFRDDGAKQHWLNDELYQPARRMTEQLMALNDWGELAVAVNLIIDPLFSEVGLSQLIRRFGPLNGDGVTPAIVMTSERDRQRNQAWTEELVRMVLAPEVEHRQRNRDIIQEWVERWGKAALAATLALAPLYEVPPVRATSFAEALARTQRGQAGLLGSLGLRPVAEVLS